MKWDIYFSYGETFLHPVHLDVSNLKTNWTWAEINEKDGMIHITREIIKTGEKIPTGWIPTHKHWTDFPETTRVGWRGSIMLWKHLSDLPKVFYDKDV